MEIAQQAQTDVVVDTEAEAILSKYAMWHREVEEKALCSPCNHCTESDHCQPCGRVAMDETN